ncbi:hypothetical protein Psfp_00170 [Pelotomaculum sp. FP]|nr:hypothetical protein Psfp_00170 [Pelotomaculum sp. FP]
MGAPAAGSQLPGVPGNSSTGSQRLQAASVTAAAQRPVGENGHVADLSGHVRKTTVEPAAKDQSPANAGADCYVNHVILPPSGAVDMLSQRGQVGVVVQQYRYGKLPLQNLADWQIMPGQVWCEVDDALTAIKRAGSAQGQGRHLFRLHPGFLTDLFDALDDLSDHMLLPFGGFGGDFLFSKHVTLSIGQRGQDFRPTQVDTDDKLLGHFGPPSLIAVS